MELNIFIDPSLLEGNELQSVIYIKQMDSWVIQSNKPKTTNIDEYNKISKDNALLMYPELKDILSLSLEKNVSFQKGKKSGIWYDFV